MAKERLREDEIRWLQQQGLLCNEQEAGDLEEIAEVLRWMPRALWLEAEHEHGNRNNNTQRRHRGMGQYD